MSREETEKIKFEKDNNVVVYGDWNQEYSYVDVLDGGNSEYSGNNTNPPTNKQKTIIKLIQEHCHEFHEFTGKTSYDAWCFIKNHSDEAFRNLNKSLKFYTVKEE